MTSPVIYPVNIFLGIFHDETIESKRESKFTTPNRFYEKVPSDDDWAKAIFIGGRGYICSSEEPEGY